MTEKAASNTISDEIILFESADNVPILMKKIATRLQNNTNYDHLTNFNVFCDVKNEVYYGIVTFLPKEERRSISMMKITKISTVAAICAAIASACAAVISTISFTIISP